MTKYHGQLFADAEFYGKVVDIEFADGETEKDIMPLLLKEGFDYLWKVKSMCYGGAKYLVNGIEYEHHGCLYLDNVLVETFKILRDENATSNRVHLEVDYCL